MAKILKAIVFHNTREINLLVKIIENSLAINKDNSPAVLERIVPECVLHSDDINKAQQLLDVALEVQKMFIVTKKE